MLSVSGKTRSRSPHSRSWDGVGAVSLEIESKRGIADSDRTSASSPCKKWSAVEVGKGQPAHTFGLIASLSRLTNASRRDVTWALKVKPRPELAVNLRTRSPQAMEMVDHPLNFRGGNQYRVGRLSVRKGVEPPAWSEYIASSSSLTALANLATPWDM
jgi:hypothetical protein